MVSDKMDSIVKYINDNFEIGKQEDGLFGLKEIYFKNGENKYFLMLLTGIVTEQADSSDELLELSYFNHEENDYDTLINFKKKELEKLTYEEIRDKLVKNM
jgi:hypothetical protein